MTTTAGPEEFDDARGQRFSAAGGGKEAGRGTEEVDLEDGMLKRSVRSPQGGRPGEEKRRPGANRIVGENGDARPNQATHSTPISRDELQ